MPKTTLSPSFVNDAFKASMKMHDDLKEENRKAKHAYEADLLGGEGLKSGSGDVLVEVPRMPGFIDWFTGILFPRSPRVTVSPETDSEFGDPTKSGALINKWLSGVDVRKRMHTCIGQGGLYQGSALKFLLDMTKRRVTARVKTQIVPWWELILDWDVNDVGQERYRGHVYWEDRKVLERRLGPEAVLPKDLKGEDRIPHLDSTGSAGDRIAADASGTKEGARFVRVLEWYNLIDDYQIDGGEKIRGVYELYLVQDLGKEDCKPLSSDPFPYTNSDGEMVCPLVPLILAFEKEHPLRGIATSKRIYPQCRELAYLRTAQANAVRKDVRLFFHNTNAGELPEDVEAQIRSGKDTIIAKMAKTPGVAWDDYLHVVTFPPISFQYGPYESSIDKDIDKGSSAPRFAQGEAMGGRTTATEVTQLATYMQNHVGELARLKDEWIAECCRVYLRVVIRAMQFNEIQSVKAYNNTRPAGEKERPASPANYDEVVIMQGTTRRDAVHVTVQDIDADFDISVVDAASTPLTREATRQIILQLTPVLLQLWDAIKEGNPMAEVILSNIVERFELPADFSATSLREKMRQWEAANPKPPQPPQGLPGSTPGVEAPLSPEQQAALQTLQDAKATGALPPIPQGA